MHRPGRSDDGLSRSVASEIGVVISDSFGRPWRNGIVNVAIGIAGIPALADYRGQSDAAGYSLHVTVLAIADEMAAAAELIMNKLDARPVAIVRGYTFPVGGAIRDRTGSGHGCQQGFVSLAQERGST